ncbi:MAG: M23 family metallopeptidase [Patescibacteria group bacterium]
MRYLAIVLALIGLPHIAFAKEIVDIAFPLEGEVSFSDDYDSPRGDGIHEAIDILAEKMTPIVAVVDGVIAYAPMDEPSYGYMITLRGDDGYSYAYIHLNNDTPGTDDGEGGPENAYVEGIERGERVERGEHIAWVGDSGNAEQTASHLHFEIEDPDGDSVNPYESLLAAYAAISYDPELEAELATSINVDRDILEAEDETHCTSDSLIRTEERSTVYYCGRDGGRYVFQDEGTYFSWYEGFDDVEFVTAEELASIPIKGVVTYKPGSFLIKVPSSPQVYAVARGGTLRAVTTVEVAESTYGNDWPESVRDISEAFFPAYDLGNPITTI